MNGFHRVSLNKKIFKREFTETAKTVGYMTYTRTIIATVGTLPVKFYDCQGDIYAYCSDKKIRKAEGSNFTFINFTSDVIPLIMAVRVNGAKKILIVSDERAELDGQTISGVPYGVAGAFCGNRLFIGNGYQLKYSQEFDYTDFSVSLDFGGVIEIDRRAGEIVYVAEDAGKLYVITEHSVFALSPYGEPYEFKMEKLTDFGLSVVKNTVFDAGGSIGFLSEHHFCALSGGKVKFLSDTLGTYPNKTLNVAGGYSGAYIMSFSADGTKYVFAYDFASGKEVVETAPNFTIAGEYAVKSGDIRYYRLRVSIKTETITEDFSGEYDFGSCRKKAVSRVEAHIRGSATLVVRGDGFFRATVGEKCNSVSCFVHGRNFHIGFENASADFKAYDIVVHYTIYGE